MQLSHTGQSAVCHELYLKGVLLQGGRKKKKGVTEYIFHPQVSTSIWSEFKVDIRCMHLSFPTGWGAFPCSQVNFQNFLINLSTARVTYFLNNLKWQLLNTFKVQVLLIIPELYPSELCASGNKAQNSIQTRLNHSSKPFIMRMLKPLQTFKQTYLFWTVSITSHIIKGWNNFCHWLATLVFGNKTKSAVSCMK